MWRQLFDVRLDGAGSLQSQIRVGIVDAILSGALPAGSSAPSSRDLATELKISRNTVVLAYHQLVDNGYLLAHERSGFVVAAREGIVPAKPLAAATLVPIVAPDWQQHFRFHGSALRSIVKPSNWQSYRYPFLYGQYDPGLFPLAEWRQCSRQALSAMELRDWAPDQIDQDDPLLIDQLRARILPKRGIWAQPSEIMITLGAQQALYLLAELLFDRNTTVGVENPGYPDMRHIAMLKSGKVSLLPVDDDGLVPGPATAACDYVYLTPSHQCPTTVTMPLARRQALIVCGGAGGKTDALKLRAGDLADATHDALLARLRNVLRRSHGFARPSVRPGKAAARIPRMGVRVLWVDQPATLPQAWSAPAAEPGAGLSCAGYGSSVTVTASMGLAAAAQAIDRILASARSDQS